jgi:hypothetical protein
MRQHHKENAVKTDDPRLEESRNKLLERVQKINDRILTVLKNHLVVEQFMNDFLDVSSKKHEGLTFAEKAKLCQELKPAEIEPPIWNVLDAANKLRNKIAHTLDEEEIQPKMDKLRDAYLSALTPTQRKGTEELDDVRIAASAFELCGSYLVGATVAAQAANKTAAIS